MVRYKPSDVQLHLQQPTRTHVMQPFATRRVVFALLGIAAFIGWSYVIFVSDLFLINRVEVRGVSMLDPLEVSREVLDTLDQRKGWRPWPTRNGLFLDTHQLQEDMKERLFAERVIVDNIHGNILRLIVEERAKRIVFHSHKQYFWVDLAGVVTDELTLDERKEVQARLLGHRNPVPTDPPIIHHDLDEQIAQGYVIDQSEHVRDWIRLSSQFMKGGLLYREFEPPMTVSSTIITVTSLQGYQVILDMDAPIQPQLDTYNAFKRAQPKVRVSEYLDVRIPGRVYLK